MLGSRKSKNKQLGFAAASGRDISILSIPESWHSHPVDIPKATPGARALFCRIDENRLVQNVFQQIKAVTSSNANAHICGETGTGKQVVAAMIHKLGGANTCPLITVDCAQYQKRKIQPGNLDSEAWLDVPAEKQIRECLHLAGGGTLILEDIRRMRRDLQITLLNVIKQTTNTAKKDWPDRPSIPRIVTTSLHHPHVLVGSGAFNSELFKYLNPVLIELKPLRSCKGELPALANHYFRYYGNNQEKQDLPESIMRQLLDYDWPGNLYELQNTIQRYLAFDEITFLPIEAE